VADLLIILIYEEVPHIGTKDVLLLLFFIDGVVFDEYIRPPFLSEIEIVTQACIGWGIRFD
jgi:hypothetical protein